MTVRANAIQHIGVTVRDLSRSLAFYEDVFDLKPKFVHRVAGSAELDAALGVEGAELTIAFLDVGNTHLELLEYHNDDRDEGYGRRNCDVGAAHVCFEIDDIMQVHRSLTGKGVDFYADPLYIDEGPLEGYTFCYLRDPDGITLELFETPSGDESGHP